MQVQLHWIQCTFALVSTKCLEDHFLWDRAYSTVHSYYHITAPNTNLDGCNCPLAHIVLTTLYLVSGCELKKLWSWTQRNQDMGVRVGTRWLTLLLSLVTHCLGGSTIHTAPAHHTCCIHATGYNKYTSMTMSVHVDFLPPQLWQRRRQAIVISFN